MKTVILHYPDHVSLQIVLNDLHENSRRTGPRPIVDFDDAAFPTLRRLCVQRRILHVAAARAAEPITPDPET